MKVFVVFKAYWMYASKVYKVFSDNDKAAECVKQIRESSDQVRAYYDVFEIEDLKDELHES